MRAGRPSLTSRSPSWARSGSRPASPASGDNRHAALKKAQSDRGINLTGRLCRSGRRNPPGARGTRHAARTCKGGDGPSSMSRSCTASPASDAGAGWIGWALLNGVAVNEARDVARALRLLGPAAARTAGTAPKRHRAERHQTNSCRHLHSRGCRPGDLHDTARRHPRLRTLRARDQGNQLPRPVDER